MELEEKIKSFSDERLKTIITQSHNYSEEYIDITLSEMQMRGLVSEKESSQAKDHKQVLNKAKDISYNIHSLIRRGKSIEQIETGLHKYNLSENEMTNALKLTAKSCEEMSSSLKKSGTKSLLIALGAGIIVPFISMGFLLIFPIGSFAYGIKNFVEANRLIKLSDEINNYLEPHNQKNNETNSNF